MTCVNGKQISESALKAKICEIFHLDKDLNKDKIFFETTYGSGLDITILDIAGHGVSMFELMQLEKFTQRAVIHLRPENSPKFYWGSIKIHMSHEVDLDVSSSFNHRVS